MKKMVYSKFQIEALHNWPGCPIEEVSYLRDLHRHVFHFVCYKKITHDDRDIEFIQFGHQAKEYVMNKYWDDEKRLCIFGAKSCEMLADELISEFDLDMCDVSEDNENGTIFIVD